MTKGIDLRIGIYLFGAASLAAGILDLIWGEFEPAHQPIQAWGDHIPGVTIFAYIAAVWLIVGGAAMLWRGSRHFGATALTILYAIFVLFPLPRFSTAPRILGYRTSVYIGVLANVCEQVVLFAAAAVILGSLAAEDSLARRMAPVACTIFGCCSVAFGLGHLTNIESVVPLVPKWLPFGGAFWAALTGIAFVLAGLAILSGVLHVLGARLLGLMLLVFSALALAPLIFASPHDHVSWGGNAFNLTVVGAAWSVADWLADRRRPIQPQSEKPVAA